MSGDLFGQLKQIGLTQIPADPANPQMRWAFDAAAALVNPDGTPAGLPDLRIGIGSSPDAEALFGAAQTAGSPGLVESLKSARAVWLGAGIDAVVTNGVPDRPVWLAVFSADGIDLLGAQPLAAGAIDAPGLLDFPSPLLLRLRIRLRGTALERAEASVEGPVRLLANVGPIELTGLEGTFLLSWTTFNPNAIGAILSNPTAVLDTQFQARLAVELRTSRPVPLLDATFTGAQVVRLAADVTSPSRTRTLSVQRLSYEHEVGGSLAVGSAVPITAGQLVLHGEIAGWTPAGGGSVTIEATGAFSLPPQVRAILTSPTSNVAGSFTLTDTGAGAARVTTLSLQLSELSLAPAVNPLRLSARSVALTLVKRGAAPWTVTLTAELRQAWKDVASLLRAAHVVELPDMARLPDLLCRLTIAVGATDTDVAIRLEPAASGRLGPFPLDAAGMFIELKARVGQPWTASGSGRFSSRAELAAIVPFQDLPITCRLSVPPPGETPQLEFTLGSGLPPLVLPAIVPGGSPISLLRLDSLTIRLGVELEFAGRVSLLPSLGNTATRLGLPPALRPVLDPLIAAVQGSSGDFRFSLRDGQPSLTVVLTASASTPPLDLFGLFAQAVPGRTPVPAPGARASATMEPLLLLTPAMLRLDASAEGEAGPRLRCAATATCTVLGETFDATLSVAASGRGAEVSLLAGSSDPIRIRIPGPGTRALVDTLDQQIQAVLDLYGVTRTSQAGRDLEAVASGLRQVLDSPEADTLITFELVDLGLTLRLEPGAEPLSIAGGIRIVQFPPILDLIFTGPTPALIIGSSGTSVFIELRPVPAGGPGTPPSPLIRIPVTTGATVDVVIHALRFGYSWQPPSFELTLRSDVIAPDMPFRGGVGFKLPAGSSTGASASVDIDLQVPSPPAPPVPILNWQMSFLGANPTAATRGLEFIVGASDTNRLLTIYLRETVFSPCFFLLMPGGLLDWGVFIGPPPEARTAATFYLDFRCGRGTMITVNPVVGVLLNPMALLPPFLTPVPPYWLVPPSLMGDYFTDETGATGIELRANIPLLVEFEAIVKRPLPTMNLQMFLEVALLVIQQFAVELPRGSALKNLFYASLSGKVRIRALDGLFGTTEAAIAASVEFNVVDILNGAVRLNQQIRDAIDDAGRAVGRATTLVADLVQDPALVVKMIPRRQRSIALETHLAALGFSLDCHVSAHVLLPDELREELRMFHEDVRPRRKSPGAFDEPPPSGPIVRLPVELDRDVAFTRARITNHRDFILPGSISRVEASVRTGVRLRAKRPLESATANVADAAATKIAADIAASSGAARRAILVRHGLGGKESEIDDDDRTIRDRGRFRATIAAKIRPDILRNATYSLEVTSLTAPTTQLARRIVDDALVGTPAGRIELRADLPAVLRRHLPRIVAKTVLGDIRRTFEEVFRGRSVTRAELDRRRPQLERTISDILRDAAVVGRRDAIAATDLEAAAEAMIMDALARARPGTQVVTRIDPAATAGFRGTRMRDWFRGFRPDLVDHPAPSPSNETDDPQGYEIRLRREHASIAPGWAVTVPSLATEFQVRLRGGAYRLWVRRDGTLQPHDLPPAFVASVPVGPRRATELQRRLQLAERRVRRPLTSKEKQLRQEGADQHVPGLYKKSIFFSPEYEIRPEGGVRGAFYLADLLRKANGTYITPNQPIAVAGFRLELLKKASTATAPGGLDAAFRVRFCGLAAAGSHLLCVGHAQHTLRFGTFRVELTGDFHLAVGDIATVGIPGAAAITANSMAFAGTVRLRDGSRELLAGEATASIAPDGAATVMRLAARVHVEWADEFAPAGVKLLKAWISGDVDVELTLGRTLRVSVDSSLTLHYSLAQFDTDTVETGFILCSPATDICWRELEQVEVVDLSDWTWGPEQTMTCRVRLDLTTGASNAVFACNVTAGIPLPGGGTFRLDVDMPSFAL